MRCWRKWYTETFMQHLELRPVQKGSGRKEIDDDKYSRNSPVILLTKVYIIVFTLETTFKTWRFISTWERAEGPIKRAHYHAAYWPWLMRVIHYGALSLCGHLSVLDSDTCRQGQKYRERSSPLSFSPQSHHRCWHSRCVSSSFLLAPEYL